MQKRFGRWVFGGVLALGAVGIALDATNVQSPARPAAVLTFVTLGPPIAIGGLLRSFDPLARVVLAAGSSLVLLTLTAMVMVSTGLWSPTGGLLAVAGITAGCLAVQWPLARRRRAAGARGPDGEWCVLPDEAITHSRSLPAEPNRGG